MLFATASPALAADVWQRTGNVADSTYSKVCVGGSDARACFQAYTKWFWLIDLDTDGEPVVMDWFSFDSDQVRAGDAFWDGGAAAGWTDLNKSYEDDGRISFRACEADVSDPDGPPYDLRTRDAQRQRQPTASASVTREGLPCCGGPPASLRTGSPRRRGRSGTR